MRFLILLIGLIIFCAPVEAKFQTEAPTPTTEFERMSYAPVYPTYSWEPVLGAEFYQVQAVNEQGKIVSELTSSESLSRVTDWWSFTDAGKYYWRVRALDKNKKPISAWSEKSFFEVTTPVTFAALGDSITHGGAAFIPAGQISCQWETFCDFPIKNIGRSGDTTEMMIARFENDVLPFAPKVLIIMGGVNDIRAGLTADEIISNLKTLREMCKANNIDSFFCTLTPINEKILRGKGIYLTDKNWRAEMEKVNAWILENGGADISDRLSDFDGELRETLTIDGLHPDLRGKMYIGRAIQNFLSEHYFNFIFGPEVW